MFHLIKLAIVISLLGFMVIIAADIFPAVGQKIEETAQGTWAQIPAEFVGDVFVQTGEKAGQLKEKGQEILYGGHR